jgi:hypothetical protein
MKKIGKTLGTLLVSAMALAPMKSLDACTGTKQMAMGGAGITISDNSHATYWNQANLANLENGEASYTTAVHGEKGTGYDDVFTAAMPIGERAGIGIHINNSEKERESGIIENTRWIKFAAGYKLKESKDGWNHSIGGAITPKLMSQTRTEKSNIAEISEQTKMNYEVSYLGTKDNVFSEGDTLRVGALLRRNETLKDVIWNFRPGISYTKSNKLGDLTLATSYYGMDSLLGLEDKNSAHGLRLGIEQKLGDKIALRAGTEKYNVKGKNERMYSAGVGFDGKKFKVGVSGTFSKELDKPYVLAEVGFKF